MLNKFNKQIESIQKEPLTIDIVSTIISYIFIVFILYYFIIKENKSPKDAFILGLCTYGIYEFTNKSLLNNWSYEIAFMDTLWGGVLFSICTYLMKIKL
jgi:uncharacterized membrane protein